MTKKKIKPTITKGAAKVPVIMQLEALECGAASLAMVMAYYGKWIPLEQVRADCGVSRDGSNAKNIYKAAESYGFKVKAFRRTPESIREKGEFPCIIHWNFNHFVVLDGLMVERKADIRDVIGMVNLRTLVLNLYYILLSVTLLPTFCEMFIKTKKHREWFL